MVGSLDFSKRRVFGASQAILGRRHGSVSSVDSCQLAHQRFSSLSPTPVISRSSRRGGSVFFALLLSLFFAGCASTRQLVPTTPQPYPLQTLTPEQKSSQAEHVLFGYPSFEGRILYREGYVLSHNKRTRVANWASYHLKNSYLVDAVQRSDDFKPDPDLPKGDRAEVKDYEGSGYDRGHLVPADDMKRSKTTMSDKVKRPRPRSRGLCSNSRRSREQRIEAINPRSCG